MMMGTMVVVVLAHVATRHADHAHNVAHNHINMQYMMPLEPVKWMHQRRS